ncbi:hypothetical protein [Pontibacter ruber]|uniref:Entericidin n=1 Tax=Pontibacter ruber TaxID=1343895 RepID=A0ABW5CVF9_9BACT|nr:hypothetical protein [Pontibacter ruber]
MKIKSIAIAAIVLACSTFTLTSCNTEQKEAPDERSIEGDTHEGNELGLDNAADTTGGTTDTTGTN